MHILGRVWGQAQVASIELRVASQRLWPDYKMSSSVLLPTQLLQNNFLGLFQHTKVSRAFLVSGSNAGTLGIMRALDLYLYNNYLLGWYS